MTNPFDRDFFKFFVGFVFILAVSFSVLYFVGLYNSQSAGDSSVAAENK